MSVLKEPAFWFFGAVLNGCASTLLMALAILGYGWPYPLATPQELMGAAYVGYFSTIVCVMVFVYLQDAILEGAST